MKKASTRSRFRSAWVLFAILLKRSAVSAYRDNALGIAKAAAYSGLLAFFPVLTTLAAILAQARANALGRTLAHLLEKFMPPEIAPLVVERFVAQGEKPAYLLVGATLVSVWAASGLTTSLMDGFQAAYRTPRNRGVVQHRLVAMLLVFAAVIPAMGASALTLFGGRAEQYVLAHLGVVKAGETIRGSVVVISRLVRSFFALGAIVLVTALLYYYGPDRRRRLRETWAGAVLATVLWWLATTGFAWYVRNIANYSVMYGSVGAAIALLIWIYLLAIIALFGCEFNAEIARLRARFPRRTV